MRCVPYCTLYEMFKPSLLVGIKQTNQFIRQGINGFGLVSFELIAGATCLTKIKKMLLLPPLREDEYGQWLKERH